MNFWKNHPKSKNLFQLQLILKVLKTSYFLKQNSFKNMSNYFKNLVHYEKKQLIAIQPFLQFIAMSSSFGSKFPVFKVLKAIFKLFQLNLLETIFLAHLIKQTKWHTKQKIIMDNTHKIIDIVCYCPQSQQYKALILYLMLLGQTVKFYLNQSTEAVFHQAIKLCSNFEQIFTLWSKKHCNLTKQISLKSLNSMYIKLFQFSRYQVIDFNNLVDVILQISPPYMPQKKEKVQQGEDKKKPTKKVKLNQIQSFSQKHGEELKNQQIKVQSQNTVARQTTIKVVPIQQIFSQFNEESFEIDLFDMMGEQQINI